MVGTLPGSKSAALPKPLVAVIGETEELLGAIESCKDRLEFVLLNDLPDEPSFWSVRQISSVVIRGITRFARFRETEPGEQISVVVAVNDLNEFSATLETGAPAVLIPPFRGDVLLSQIESQLHLIKERRCYAQLLSAQKELLQMIASGAELESTIETAALLIEGIESGIRCAISALHPDGVTFSKVFAPSLPRLCKVRLLHTPVGPPMLNPNRNGAKNYPASLLAELAAEGDGKGADWAKALIAEGIGSCLFIPILNSKRRPVAVLSLFGGDANESLESNFRWAQSVADLIAIAFEKGAREEELASEREQLRLVLTAGKLGLWNWDLLTNELEWSEQGKKIFGYSPSAKVTFEDFLGVLHPKDHDRTMKAIEASIQNDVPCDIEFRIVQPDQSVRWISATGRTFRDAFDQPTRMGGVARDVTERRQFDEELQENQFQLRTALNAAELARREAETATRAKDQFLAILSHELRTPLTPIMMAASWLRNAQQLSEQARMAFDMIFRNAEIEARLIDDLLDLTRISRNQLELQFGEVDLHTVLRAAIEVCETGVQQKKQSLHLQWAAKRSAVQCDVARIQ
jgi:PAS domain S-box-containing protein